MKTAHELSHLLTDDLYLCGCGNPGTAAVLILQTLRLCPFYEHREELDALLPNYGVRHLIFGLLTKANLLEHGGGIGGSWLTSEGHNVLASLEKIAKDDPELESLFPGMETPPSDCEICYPVASSEQTREHK